MRTSQTFLPYPPAPSLNRLTTDSGATMHSTSTWLKAAAFGVMVWGTSAATGCAAEVTAEPVYYPPPAFLASTAPVYYEGRPAWFYNDRWYFRSGGGWSYYRSEPGYLYHQRVVVGRPAGAYVRGGGARVVVHER